MPKANLPSKPVEKSRMGTRRGLASTASFTHGAGVRKTSSSVERRCQIGNPHIKGNPGKRTKLKQELTPSQKRKRKTDGTTATFTSKKLKHGFAGETTVRTRTPHVPDEENVKPIKTECCKKVGVKGGKLQLDSFGIELEIPPGAIDSEEPREISLRVLTDTSNLGNSKNEMSVCFGVQCLAPDDLVLKLPVTYTIPHCAVLKSYSRVQAVLYTGEGKYTPDAVENERIMLSISGSGNSCIIRKDVLKLKMNHFSWSIIRLFRNFRYIKGKKMCCRSFNKEDLAQEKKPVIVRAHLYEDLKGITEFIKLQEREQKFIPATPELQVVIQAAEGDLEMTCYVKKTVVGGPNVVSFEKLMEGTRICEPFQLDFTDQPNIVVVSLKIGQNERLQVDLLFQLDFSTPQRRARDSKYQDQWQNHTVRSAKPSPNDLDNEMHYVMWKSKVKGNALVIGNSNFPKKGELPAARPRPWADMDIYNMDKLLAALGYNVQTGQNLSKPGMEEAVKEFTEQLEKDKPQSAVVYISTHGNETGIEGFDRNILPIPDLLKMFSGVLLGKPKVLIIDACWGVDKTCRSKVAASSVSSGSSIITYFPENADIFMIHSTSYGKMTWSCTINGSWLVNQLCKVVYSNDRDLEDLDTIMLRVTTGVHEIKSDDEDGKDVGTQSTTVFKQGVGRKLFFYPGYPPTNV